MAFVTLTVMEIVLGIDNIVFISILSGKLPPERQALARQLGLSLAMIMRILLLVAIKWLTNLTSTLFQVPTLGLLSQPHPVSGRDLILLAGGLFLIAKATHEIHDKLEGEDGQVTRRMAPTLTAVIVQILLLDIVFSLDSVITAVGMARHLPIMIAAVVLAVGVMLLLAGRISEFIHCHPSLKILALSFLLLVGFTLVIESFHREIPKGYIYFAMAFSVGVEMLNIKGRTRPPEASSVALAQPYR